ncbi:hypothetical protein Fot_44720 [Forsythia ovata]|uniref:Uncharacterized protein n=1 Tax=Forsythia ovata TaxID=205694 RepID=A0ABD1R4C2_9LAMI
MPERGMEDAEDPRRARRGPNDPSSGVKDCVLHDRGASRNSIPHSPGKPEYINIGSRHDELDPTALGKLSAPAAIATASVHKYWTSTFRKAAVNAELTELLKLVEMYTSRSHVLNCKLYKVLGMRVDELSPMVGRDEDVDALRLENKDLREQLAFSEDARTRAIYDIIKAKTIQKACVQAQKTAESQPRVVDGQGPVG